MLIGKPIDHIIGDMDSIDETTVRYYAQRGAGIHADADQYSTDFQKALRLIDGLTTKPLCIVIYGGLHGRADQALSQLHQLYAAQSLQKKFFLVTTNSIIMLLHAGRNVIEFAPQLFSSVTAPGLFSKHVGIVPLAGCSRVRTTGLEWNLADEEMEFGKFISTSNHVLSERVIVESSRSLLFTVSFAIDATVIDDK